ncbi:hypothetical protein GE061_000556 [Apolygus lucorum]|uniref:Uncharacterized protein n=1 Tax=Apolygus lucorum TaxID=248454 RepID=A0A8S9Y7B7_APOLU|nr:hypothetical protein GE061_000556 [Apolygus lucorum]
MDSSQNAKSALLVALGQKNEQLRLKFSGALTRNLQQRDAEKDVDPDYVPCNEGSEFSDSDSVSDVQPSEKITAKRPVVKKVINQKRCKRPAESDVDMASVVRELLDDLLDCAAEGKSYCAKGVAKKGEKRKRSAYNQPLNVRKSIKRKSLIESHAVKPPCNSDGPRKRRRGCTTLISQERQNAINDNYWALNSNEKRAFVMRSQRRVPKQRERMERREDGNNNDGGIESRKANTYQYVLHDEADELQEDCESCEKWKSHHEKYQEARIEYQRDAAKPYSPDEVIVSADLQKVIMLPRADEFKEVIFIPRVIAFNESFVPVGPPPTNRAAAAEVKPLAVIWHVAISGRKKSDIASAFYAFFRKNRDQLALSYYIFRQLALSWFSQTNYADEYLELQYLTAAWEKMGYLNHKMKWASAELPKRERKI